LSSFLAEAFGFVHEIKKELQSGVVHLAVGAQMLDTAELTQALDIEQCGLSGISGGGTDEPLLQVVEDGPGIDARQFGDDFDGIVAICFHVVNGEISGRPGGIGVHGAVV
jgi:hypothetical protein